MLGLLECEPSPPPARSDNGCSSPGDKRLALEQAKALALSARSSGRSGRPSQPYDESVE